MRDVSQLILTAREVGENIASISQDIGLLLQSEGGDDTNGMTRVKHSKGLVDSILSTLTVLSTTKYKATEKYEDLYKEVRKIEFSCVGLQSVLSQSLINIDVFHTHENTIKSFLQKINVAANRMVTLSLVAECHTNTVSNVDTVMGRETNCFSSDNTMGCCDEDHKHNGYNTIGCSGNTVDQLNDEKGVCYSNKAACEENCDGICYQDKYDGSDISSCMQHSETCTGSSYPYMESGLYEDRLHLDQINNPDIGYNENNYKDEKTFDVILDTSTNSVSYDDAAGISNLTEFVSETVEEATPDSNYDLHTINKQESITDIQDPIEDKVSRYEHLSNTFEDSGCNIYDSGSDVVSPSNVNEYNNNLHDNTSEGVDSSDTDCTTKLIDGASDEGGNVEDLGLITNETQNVYGQLREPITKQETTAEGSGLPTVYDDITSTESPIKNGFENTVETPTSVYDSAASYETTTVNYEMTTEDIESTTFSYHETTTECTTPAYETTTQDLYKVSQDIYSAAQDLSTKANDISSINSDISSKISNINSMVSDLNTYDDDELSKKIQSVSKITQEITSKTSEISSLCSTTSSLASDISSASSDMPSADRHHRFRTSPWQKMSGKCQEMVTACQSIVTAAQDILLNLDNVVSHTETLRVADAVSSGVYDVMAKTQLVISETLNIVSAVIELMNVIES